MKRITPKKPAQSIYQSFKLFGDKAKEDVVALSTSKKRTHDLSSFKLSSSLARTILIAEDDPVVQLYYETLFKDTAYHVIYATNGLEAVNCYRKYKNEIGLVLMDIKMPVMTGVEAIGEILKSDPEATIVAQTAFTLDAERQVCMSAGCIDVITKPVNRKEIFSKIECWLKRDVDMRETFD